MEPPDVNTRVQTCNYDTDTSCNNEKAQAPGSHCCLSGCQSSTASEPLMLLWHLSPRKLLIFNCEEEFLQRVRCDSGFSQGFKDTSYSFYQSQNMVEIQHELLFLSINLKTTQTESYNAGTPSSNHY